MPKDYHFLIRDPHMSYIKEIAQLLWEQHGNTGPAVQYDSMAIRHCVYQTHRELFPEKHK
jgi:hypothetical protein